MSTCAMDHAGEVPREIEKLSDSQAGFWRHKCAGCAYLLGRQHAEEAEERLRDQVRALRRENTRLLERVK